VLKWQTLSVDNEVIGYLGFSLHHNSGSQRELEFLERQSNNFLLFGLFALIASGAFALPIASFLVRPIRKLQSATENLSHGDFKTRVTVSGNDELAQLGQHFNHLAKTLEENEHQRRRWVADISHELRTPVTFIKGQIESFVDGIRKADNKNLLALEKQINQLNKLINDLYQLSLSELGALNYKKSDQLVCPIIESVITSVETAYKNKNLDLKVNNTLNDEYRQFLDPDRLEQLLLNLLTNSLRYTDTPGLVSLTCVEKNNALMLIVQDTPPGVPEQDLPHLFETLYRSESSRNRDYGGAGIGLAICKNIINAHNGSIAAEASEQGGLRIVCTLPTSPEL
jgi:two-component system sensor histidine kinase BaeS